MPTYIISIEDNPELSESLRVVVLDEALSESPRVLDPAADRPEVAIARAQELSRSAGGAGWTVAVMTDDGPRIIESYLPERAEAPDESFRLVERTRSGQLGYRDGWRAGAKWALDNLAAGETLEQLRADAERQLEFLDVTDTEYEA